MNKIPFTIETIAAWTVAEEAYLDEGEDPIQALREAVIQAIEQEVHITIGDVQECLMFWLYPESWQTEWAEKLNLGEDEDAVAAVYALLAAATEES